MNDRFDYATYRELLARIRATHRILAFADVGPQNPPEPFCILRHDVDYSTAAAIRLAIREAEQGIRATYFLMVGSDYYNLLSPQDSHIARTLTGLGHEVGLHYDVNTFLPFPRSEWLRLLHAQAALLSDLAGAPVRSIAMHQPALNGADPFAEEPLPYLNAYAPRFTRDATYVSDSCRAWRDDGWAMFADSRLPPHLQLCLHPINWNDIDRDRVALFRSLHSDAAERVVLRGEHLLEKIACHSGVLEHEARLGRQR